MDQTLYAFVQQCAEAIGNALDVEVTIIDSNFIRIAGTGRYREKVGAMIPQYFVSATVIKTGNSFMIDSTRENDICKKCQEYEICTEKGHINIPITDGKKIYGAISILCTTEEQFDVLVKKQKLLVKFLKNIGELLVSKFKENEYVKLLVLNNSQFNVIFSTMSDGILMTDDSGVIINCSDAISKLINLSKEKLLGQNVTDLFTGINMDQINVSEGKTQFSEIKLKKSKKLLLSLISAIITNRTFKGLVIVLMEDSKINSLIYNKIGLHQILKFNDMIGESVKFKEAVMLGKKAAAFDSNILILGESGTGKELFSRSIHNHNSSINTPFIAINCAAIPESLLESELFGYEDGAFTGARQSGKPGKFEIANGGTIFLDEIGDMPLHLQAKILRVLQDKMIERIGGISPIPLNIRVIAATNKNLTKMVENKEFREDLYYRLNVFQIKIPSLRERRGDIPLLIDHFIEFYSEKFGLEKKKITPTALSMLTNYEWKGNVRELQNTIEYICCVSSQDTITTADVQSKIFISVHESNFEVNDQNERLDIIPIKDLEKREIEKALNKFGYTTSGKLQAAKALNIGKSTLYRKLIEYGIDN